MTEPSTTNPSPTAPAATPAPAKPSHSIRSTLHNIAIDIETLGAHFAQDAKEDLEAAVALIRKHV
jgi:hypothetical protein